MAFERFSPRKSTSALTISQRSIRRRRTRPSVNSRRQAVAVVGDGLLGLGADDEAGWDLDHGFGREFKD
ncbi:hypothetical protein [Amaricoccus sp.]|uniref:hypothetical protein n=1 Tax=Amaricoccus sp. TaxID=1872485 RepID=UPI001B5EF3DC|nr:hypothetical protein [Amaricoccus sp.]MBP7240402.1 hypothetical protein [Amaricoccus sp.]